MTPTYTIVKLPDTTVAGDTVWTVVQYKDGICKGGDLHWIRERYAERAKRLYEAGPGYHALHGGYSSPTLADYYQKLFDEPMFESDQDYQIALDKEAR